MSKLSNLHTKYEFDTPIEGMYEPDQHCKKCGGAGEYPHPTKGMLIFCMCLFIEGQSQRDWIAPMLAKAAKQSLEDVMHHKGKNDE